MCERAVGRATESSASVRQGRRDETVEAETGEEEDVSSLIFKLFPHFYLASAKYYVGRKVVLFSLKDCT